MLDKKKIRIMSKMSLYEKKYGEEDLRITAYFEKDYVSLNRWITLIWVTVGYAFAAALYVLCNAESLMEELTVERIIFLLVSAVVLYLIVMVAYGVGVSFFYRYKYREAKKRAKEFARHMAHLEKIYEKENDKI